LHSHADPSSLTFLIESNPTNLDPHFAPDAQSQKPPFFFVVWNRNTQKT